MSVQQSNFNLVQVSAVLPWLFVWVFSLFKGKWDFTGQQSLWCSPSSLAFSFLAVSVPALESYASLSFINHLFIFVLPLCWTCKTSPRVTACFLDMMPLYFGFFHLQPLTHCFLLLQLLLMTSYTGHFPLSYFPSAVSIGLLLHSAGEFAFHLRVLAYFPFYSCVFPVPCWWTFSVLLQLSVWAGICLNL